MFVGVINGRWIVNGKQFKHMSSTDKETLSKGMKFKKEAYESYYKHKIKK